MRLILTLCILAALCVPLLSNLEFDVANAAALLVSSVQQDGQWSSFCYAVFLKFLFQNVFQNSLVYKTETFTNFVIFSCVRTVFIFLGKRIVLSSMTYLELDFFATTIINLFIVNSDSVANVVLRNLVGSLFASIVIVLVPYVRSSWLQKQYQVSVLVNESVYFVFLCQFAIGFLVLEYTHLHEFFVTWFLHYIFGSWMRICILAYWVFFLVLIAVIFINILLFNSGTQNKVQSSEWNSVILNYKRKVWHYVIFLILIPLFASSTQLQFLKLVLSFLITAFVIVEIIRYLNINFTGHIINLLLQNFKDFRDAQGPIIISYQYLLIGVSIPIFFDNSCLGLIALGIGDSFASILGKKFGKTRWFDSSKTIVGTLGFVSISFVICSILKYLSFPEFHEVSFLSILVTCLVGGLVEAFSDLNDNILIPCVMIITMDIVK